MWEELQKYFGNTKTYNASGIETQPGAPVFTNPGQSSEDFKLDVDAGLFNRSGQNTGTKWGSPEGIGAIGAGFSGVANIAQALAAFGTLKLGRQQLKENQLQYRNNYNNLAQTTNMNLEDRQQARIAGEARAVDQGYASNYQSVGDYMDKNRVQRLA